MNLGPASGAPAFLSDADVAQITAAVHRFRDVGLTPPQIVAAMLPGEVQRYALSMGVPLKRSAAKRLARRLLRQCPAPVRAA